jgi:ubiquinone/menaquinone biosynthesis C-methylase UbiE
MGIAELAPSNAAQAASWDGPEGRYWAAHRDHFDRSVARYQPPFLAAAEIGPAAQVLDIGCGTGQTTREAARVATVGSALGVDLSADMIAVAVRVAAAAGVSNVGFVQGDAQVHPFPPQRYDRVISRTGSMFFAEPAEAFANIRAAMAPDGRLTLLTWQAAERNEWIGTLASALLGRAAPVPAPGAPGPFSLSDPGRVRSLLETAGFEWVDMHGLAEPMIFGTDVDDAHHFVLGLLGWMLEGQDGAARRRAEDRLRATLEAHLTGDGVAFSSATWLVTARCA